MTLSRSVKPNFIIAEEKFLDLSTIFSISVMALKISKAETTLTYSMAPESLKKNRGNLIFQSCPLYFGTLFCLVAIDTGFLIDFKINKGTFF